MKMQAPCPAYPVVRSSASVPEKVKLTIAGNAFSDMRYHMPMTVCMGKLMKSYCETAAVSPSEMSFYYNGKLIKEQDTPKQLDIKFREIMILAVHNVPGGFAAAATAFREAEIPLACKFCLLNLMVPPGKIHIQIVGNPHHLLNIVHYTMECADSLGKVMEMYSEFNHSSCSSLVFYFGYHRVKYTDNPWKLNMKNNDKITVLRIPDLPQPLPQPMPNYPMVSHIVTL